MCSVAELQETLAKFGGNLKFGSHTEEEGECCGLELEALCQSIPITDNPQKVRMFDLRPINDIVVPDDIRTQHLLPVIAAYAGSLDWPIERQKEVVSKIVIGTVNRIISQLPSIGKTAKNLCLQAITLSTLTVAVHAVHAYDAAAAAAYDAAAAASYAVHTATAYAVHAAAATAYAVHNAEAAAYAVHAAAAAEAAEAAAAAAAAYAAAEAAAYAVHAAAAAEAARISVFTTACEVWLNAVTVEEST